MSSIPVRKVASGSRRATARINSDEGKEKMEKTSEDRKKHSPGENKTHAKQLSQHSSKKELLDENSRMQEELKHSQDQFNELKDTLKSTQDQLHATAEESVRVKESCERMLLSANIDPVTLEKMPCDPDDIAFRQRRDKNKETVTALKERLKTYDTEGTVTLQNLKDISTSLDGLVNTLDNLPSYSTSLMT